MKKNSTIKLTMAGLTACAYVVLSLITLPIMGGAIQFRISEALHFALNISRNGDRVIRGVLAIQPFRGVCTTRRNFWKPYNLNCGSFDGN